MRQKGTFIFIFLVILSCEIFSQTSWEVDKCKDDIVVYTREEEGSAFKSFKAIVTLEASLEEVLEILRDADNYSKWYGYTKASKVLKQEKDIQYNYVETIFPWPFSNRDMVYKMSIDGSKPDEVLILLEGIPDFIPKRKGIVRMQKATGTIQLKSINDSMEVTYQFHSEPGENLPIWLANNSIAELPFKTLSGLKKLLEEG